MKTCTKCSETKPLEAFIPVCDRKWDEFDYEDADAILSSQWLADHDAAIRKEAREAALREVASEWRGTDVAEWAKGLIEQEETK